MHKPSPEAASSTWGQIEDQVASYSSPSLTQAQESQWLPRLRELTLAVPPTDAEDARGMLLAGVRFMVDTTATASTTVSVDDVLDGERIARWSYRALGQGLSAETVRHYSARLNRLERVRRGLPGRMRGEAVERTPSTPLCIEEIQAVLGECRARGAEVLAAALAAFGAGCTEHHAVGGRVGRIGDRWVFVTPGGEHFDVVPQLADEAFEIAGVKVPEWSWPRVRRAATAVGVPLTGAIARQSFRLMVLNVDAPAADLLVRFRITKEALIKIRPFLPEVPSKRAYSLLRGRVR